MTKSLVSVVLLVLLACGACSASSIGYDRVKCGAIAAHVVTVNLADPNVRVSVALAARGRGSAEGFKSMVNRTRPSAAITGTFFDTKTLIPTGDLCLFGTLVHEGCIGSALCIDADNKASIVPLGKGRKSKWVGYETVMCAGPTLVADGRIGIEPLHEGFRRTIMAGTRRTAVGITKSGKLLFVAINRRASLYDLAKLMIKLNAQSAVLMDGGSSTALYFAGSYLAVPGRTLTNCLVAYPSVASYERAKCALVPPKLLARARQRAAMSGITALVPGLLLAPDDPSLRILPPD